jgi:hypothetical protein
MAASASVGVALLRLREGGLLAVEHRSDGTVTVTVVNDLGGELSPSGRQRARLLTGRGALGAGSSFDAALAGTIGDGVTWTLPDAAAAARLVRAIQGGSRLPAILRGVPNARRLPPGVPPPTAVSRRRELSGSLHLALGAGPLHATIDLDARDVVAWGEEPATGRRSVVLGRHAAAALSGRVGSRATDASAGADEEVVLVLDAGGRPLEIVRVETADVRGSRDLPATAQPAAGLLATRGGRRTAVVETHLDLGDAGNLRAAAQALAAARGGAPPWRSAAVGAALRDRFDRFGVVHARVYADDERRYGVDLPRGGLPVELGLSKTFTTTRLLAAATRGIDGLWTRREDCLAAR